MPLSPQVLALFILPLLAMSWVQAQDTKILSDFESPADLALWSAANGSATISTEHATHGVQSVKFSSGESFSSERLPRDWSGNDSCDIDFFVDGT